MRIPTEPRFPQPTEPDYNARLAFQLLAKWREIAQQINGVTEGRIYAYHAAATSAPTTGDYQRGDFILNSEPEELGSAGSKYIVHGWRCIEAGTPGTWVEMRFLTGN